jgi:acetoin utilization protein AcuB
MVVSEYMTPEPFVMSECEPLAEVAEVLRRGGIRQIPITDESNRLVGIVTDRDVLCVLGNQDPRKVKLKARDIMTTELVTVTPTTRLEEALEILSRERFAALPVVVCGYVVGMLSKQDLLRRFLDLLCEQDMEPVSRTAALIHGRPLRHDLGVPYAG